MKQECPPETPSVRSGSHLIRVRPCGKTSASAGPNQIFKKLLPPEQLEKLIRVTPLARLIALTDLRIPSASSQGIAGSPLQLGYPWRAISTVGLLAGTITWGVTRIFPKLIQLPEPSTFAGAITGEFVTQLANNFGNFCWGGLVASLVVSTRTLCGGRFAPELGLLAGCFGGAILPEITRLPLLGTPDLQDIPAGLLGALLVYCFSVSKRSDAGDRPRDPNITWP